VKVDGDLTGISPIKSPASKRRVNFEKTNRCAQNSRLKDLEAKVRRYESECRSQKSRIHSLNQQLQEKDRVIRNLEHKLPQVLADVSRGIHHTREAAGRKHSLKEVRDAMYRNHILNQKIKELERKLESQKESCLQIENERLRTELKLKDKIIRQSSVDLSDTRRQVDSLEAHIARLDQDLNCGQYQLADLRTENDYLYNEIKVQYNALIQTEEDLKSLEEVVDKLRRLIPSGKMDLLAPSGYENKDTSGLNTSSGRKRRRWNNTWPQNLVIASPLLKEIEDCELVGEFSYEAHEDMDNTSGDKENSCKYSCKSDGTEYVEKTSDWSSSDEFENSHDKSEFCTRLEDLDFKLEVMLNKLNSTVNPNTTTN
jgi:predicted  nucleic acid-binding Zn-ribbon protein